ncbi:hypothetical protein LG293_14420 [Citricoccus nitrophenolicus]
MSTHGEIPVSLDMLLTEEIRSRDGATRASRRKAGGLPAGKTFDSWRATDASIPAPAQAAAAEAPYRLADATYERRSLAVTSNIHPFGLDPFMPATLATAAVERLLHDAHIIVTESALASRKTVLRDTSRRPASPVVVTRWCI